MGSLSVGNLRKFLGVFAVSALFLAGNGKAQVAAHATGVPVRLPLAFERLRTGPADRFTARGPGYLVGLQHAGATIEVLAKDQVSHAISLEFAGSSVAKAVPGPELAGKINYVLGNDKKKWQLGLPTYERVSWPGVYPGIDVVYYGNQQQLEFDLVVKPGADPGAIRLKIAGAGALSLDDSGALNLGDAAGGLRVALPQIYQEVSGVKKNIPGHFAIRGRDEIAFEVESYDRTRPLVIDPTIVYSGVFGGGSNYAQSLAIGVDSAGNILIAGHTGAADFPTLNAVQDGLNGQPNAFITKINPAGTALIYSTYLGGSSGDYAKGLAIDSAGSAWVTGLTYSSNFPLLNATQGTFAGNEEAFVAKLSAAGGLEFSTYLGSGYTDAAGVAVDGSGNGYVTGISYAGSFPTTAGVVQPTAGAAFVTKYSPTGTVIYSTLLGGSSTYGYGIAVDSSGAAYVTGYSFDGTFAGMPAGGAQTSNNGNGDAFVAKLNPDATALVYFTFLGGAGTDGGNAIAVDSSGNAYVAGNTSSTGLATPGAAQTALAGGTNGFAAKLNASGSAFTYLTYLGGGHFDSLSGLALDGSGNVYLAGYTDSANFPTASPLQSAFPGNAVSLSHSTDSGATFSPFDLTIPGAVNQISINPSGASAVALTESGTYRTTNGGTSWTQQSALGSSGYGISIARSPVAPGTIYVSSCCSSIFRSTDDGVTFSYMGNLPGEAGGLVADSLTANTLYMFGYYSPYVFVSTDGGATWNPAGTGLPAAQVTSMVATSDGALYAGTLGFGIYKSTNQGGSWTAVNTGLPPNSSVYYANSLTASGNTVYLAAGTIYVTTNGGASWAPTTGSVGSYWVAASPQNASILYAFTFSGSVQESADGGATWGPFGTGLPAGESFAEQLLVDPGNSAHVLVISPVSRASFVAKLNASGTALAWSTYFGGTGDTYAYGVATDGGGDVFLTGQTSSYGFPLTSSALPTGTTFITEISDATAACSTLTISPGNITITPYGQTLTFDVIAPSGCSWTASTNQSWAVITSGASGTALGMISVQVAYNGTSATQTAVLTVGTQNVTITQPSGSCTYSMDMSTYNVPAAGGSLSAVLTTGAGCPWTVTNNYTGAISFTSASSGTGSATIGMTVSPNTTSNTRNFYLSVGTTQINIAQPSPTAVSPTLGTVSPTSATAGGPGFILTVNGSNFNSGSIVNWGGTALSTSFLSASELSASVPSAYLLTTAGMVSVTVVNTGGLTSAGATFTILQPAVGSLSPSSVATGAPAFTLTVNGSNFVPGSTVEWGGTALSTAFVNSTQLTASVSAANIPASTGTVNVTVMNPGGATSGVAVFTIVPGPAIGSLSPYSATVGGPAFTLTVTGANFASGATVEWGGTALSTAFLSATQLTASVTAGLIGTSGVVNVTVMNPDGSASGAAAFAVLAPSGQTWTQLSPTGGPPATREGHTAVYDPATSQMILYGGTGLSGPLGDVWSLSTGANPQWTSVTPGGTAPGPKQGASAVYDSADARMTIFGGGMASFGGSSCSNDVWTLTNANSVAGTPGWTQLFPTGSAPGARIFHQAVYDPGSNRMIVYGGSDCAGGFYNSVWVLTNANGLGGTPAWIQLTPTGAVPPAREAASAVYDPTSNSMIIFGGQAGLTVFNDVWILSGANGVGGNPAWTQLAPAGVLPAARSFHSAIYDPASNHMTVFGGQAPQFVSDTWVLTNANGSGSAPLWTQLAPLGTIPASREGQSAVFDSSTNRMIMFGGIDYPDGLLSDVWTLSDANGAFVTATSVTPTTTPVNNPAAAITITGTNFNATSTVLFTPPGGTPNRIAPSLIQAAQLAATIPSNLLTTAGTAQVAVTNASGVPSAALAFTISPLAIGAVSPNNAVPGSGATAVTITGQYFNSGAIIQWTTPGGATVPISPSLIQSAQLAATIPSSLLTTAGTAQIAVSEPGSTLSNTLSFTIQGSPALTGLSPSTATVGGPAFTLTANGTNFVSGSIVEWGGTPLSTAFVSATQLTASVSAGLLTTSGAVNVTVMNPGGISSSPVTFTVLAPSGQTWTQLSPTGGPPSARSGQTAVFDPVTGQMIVFAGGGDLSDVWSLSTGVSPPQWTNITPAGTPPTGRSGASAIYDSANSRMTIFGGAIPGFINCTNDVWTLTNANSAGGTPAWTQLNPTGTPPPARTNHQAIYDPASNRMIVFGGFVCAGIPTNDVWVLTNANGLGGTPAWIQLLAGGPLPFRSAPSAVYDPASNRLIVFGGISSGRLNDVWVLSNANGLGGTPVWTQLSPSGSLPSPRSGSTAIYDPASNHMTVFGGSAGTGLEFNDTWVLSNANGTGGAPAWSQLAPQGTIPAVRSGHTSVLVPATNQMIVFGGSGPGSLNDVWSLSDANGVFVTASSITPGTSPVNNPAAAVTIAGTNFNSSSTILFTPPGGSQTTIAPSLIQAAQLAATIPGALLTTAGTAQVAVTNSSGAPSASLSFTISPVTISAVTLNNAASGSGPTGVTVSGRFFNSGAVVQWTTPGGTVVPIVPSLIQSAQLAATIPASLLTTAGTAQIAISEPGSTLSNSLPFTIVSAASQTITFGPLSNQTLGSSPPPLGATATSGLTVTFVSNNTSVCTVSGVNITLLATGVCSITAGQPGNSTYAAANTVTQTFNVTTLVGTPPTTVSVTPSSGSGGSGTFVFSYSSPNGASYLSRVDALFNGSLNGAAGCWVYYKPSTNGLYLFSNTVASIYGPLTPGSGGTLQNDQCTINGTGSSVVEAGNTLTLTLSINFTSYFRGLQTIFGDATDAAALTSNWQTLGSWTSGTLVSTPPTATSITPASGAGGGGSFTFNYSDLNGYSYMGRVDALFNGGLSATNGCYVIYWPATNVIFLQNDSATVWSAALTPGQAGTISNSQCSINGPASSVSGSGSTLSLTLAVSFTPGFAGTQTMFGIGYDKAGVNGGWQTLGTWNASGVINSPPTADSVSPSSGSATSGTFAFKYSSANGPAYLSRVDALFNGSLNGAAGCWVYYLPGTNGIYLYSNTVNAVYGPLTPGSSGTIQNDQCTINGTGTTATGSGNTLTLNLNMTFNNYFRGLQTMYAYATDDEGGVSGWQTVGTWTTGTLVSTPPTAISITPSSGTGTSGTFTFNYSSVNGYSYMNRVDALFNGSLSSTNGCYVIYWPATNVMFLVNDAGTIWSAALTPGSPGTISNSQCSISGPASSVSGSGSTLSLTLGMSFSGSFTGSQTTFGIGYDKSGANGGWANLGNWTP